METVSAFRHPIERVENIWIPLKDGQKMAAKMWIPKAAIERPVPAIFEYIPYRKRDLTRERDEVTHAYLAGHGYACVRVDLRGSGESDGVLKDQYREQELSDAIAAIQWIAEQDWCDGKVGMMGISWGGFNSLQVAALRPPELKAIITVCSTDDLYSDNMHYMGGCLLTDNLSEATTMFSVNTCPPDPEIVGDRWRELWMERLKGSGHWLDVWLRHQRRDEYWEHGSVSEDYSQIQCPVMTVGGWADGYTNAVFRLLAKLEVPRLGLVGPWGHKYPHMGVPGPAIGFLQEALRWWDHWLKDQDTGIMREPMLRAWMQESVPPTTFYNERPGRWVAERGWPSPDVTPISYPLTKGAILSSGQSAPDEEITIQSPLSVGLFAGKWCSYSAAPDLPHDQREEDGGALVFDSEPLSEGLEIIGAPTVEFELSSNRPVAMVAVRLSSVAPDDSATRVTYGVLNLCHAEHQAKVCERLDEDDLLRQFTSGEFHLSYAQPKKLEPGRRYKVRAAMNHIAQSFPKGNRLRVSVSTSYWPLVWTPPEPVRLKIWTGPSRLILPERKPKPEDAEVKFAPAQGAESIETTRLEACHHNWLVHRDLAKDESSLEVIKDEGVVRYEDIELDVTDRTYDIYTYVSNDFSSPKGETRTERGFRRGQWSVKTTTRTVLTADKDNFYIDAELDAFEGDRRVYSQNWQRTIPRDHI